MLTLRKIANYEGKDRGSLQFNNRVLPFLSAFR
jgi:hypothetical protein